MTIIDNPAANTAAKTANPSTSAAKKAKTKANNMARLTRSEHPERHFVPKRSGKPDPAGHLSAEQIEELGRELDAIRDEVMHSRGEKDAKYIRRVVAVQRYLELGSRGVLLFSHNKVAWVVGTAGLSVAKILENMELGHNIMHGQWDWMRDPKIHSQTWDWDNATPADLWKHSHNELHHTYTNVIGKDNDLGFGIMRVDEDQRWYPHYVGQPLWCFINACLFEYGIAIYDLELGKVIAGHPTDADFKKNSRKVLNKVGSQMRKDFIAHPLLSGPNFVHTLTANMTASFVRNMWTNGVILCGHFPKGVETFSRSSIEEETRGEWYLRQLMGAANISGGTLTHIMTGNLSHQIEHHLFPDMPSNRYAEIAPKVKALMERYDLNYVTGPYLVQLASAWSEVIRYSLPNGAWDEIRKNPIKGFKSLHRAMKRGRA